MERTSEKKELEKAVTELLKKVEGENYKVTDVEKVVENVSKKLGWN